MVGASWNLIAIPVVSMVSLAILIGSVMWAAYHPGWKHHDGRSGASPYSPAILHNRTWLDAERDLGGAEAVPEHEPEHGEAPEPRSTYAAVGR